MKFQKRQIPEGNGGTFLKFKDGDSKVGMFRGELYEFWQVWDSGKSRVVSDDTEGAKSRFRLNFVTKEDGELKAKIFEFGLTVYNQLAEISEDYELDKTWVKITRRGTGTDTTYIVIPAKDQPDAKQMKIIDSVKLNILEHKDKPKSQAADSDDLPF